MKESEKTVGQDLLSKFITGEISDSEIDMLNVWLETDPENRRIFDIENELWQAAGVNSMPDYARTETAWMNISTSLGFGKNKYRSVTVIRTDRIRILFAAAVVASLLAVGGMTLWRIGNSSLQKMVVASTQVSTREGGKAHIMLPDSTDVILNSGSSIQYDGRFNQKDRIVNFKGEAFFDVSTNPEKPFIVNLGRISIAAKGTRFNVFSFEDENRVEATLEEGVIQVSINGKDNINMKSGQQMVYFVDSGEVLIRDVAIDTYTSWKENKLRFYDSPLEEVMRRIGRKYNVVFEVTDQNLLNLKYTATFIDESIEEVMERLKTVSPIAYEITNRTSVNDKKYLKPKIIIKDRKSN